MKTQNNHIFAKSGFSLIGAGSGDIVSNYYESEEYIEEGLRD